MQVADETMPLPADDPAAADLARQLTELRHRFPRVMIWYGQHTGRWWAMHGYRLVEGGRPAELGARLDAVLGRRPAPPPPPPRLPQSPGTGRADGSWA